jgi:hypothetical protein
MEQRNNAMNGIASHESLQLVEPTAFYELMLELEREVMNECRDDIIFAEMLQEEGPGVEEL